MEFVDDIMIIRQRSTFARVDQGHASRSHTASFSSTIFCDSFLVLMTSFLQHSHHSHSKSDCTTPPRDFNAPAPLSAVFQSRTIREFDASFVVKQFGFRDVEDYYSAASLTDKLHRIQVPLLGLNAADDPFIPFKGGFVPCKVQGHTVQMCGDAVKR